MSTLRSRIIQAAYANPELRADLLQIVASTEDLYKTIRNGDRVTIRTPDGKSRSGTATMRGPAGWVLNMGGAHGTPAIASPANIVSVQSSKKAGQSVDKQAFAPSTDFSKWKIFDDPGSPKRWSWTDGRTSFMITDIGRHGLSVYRLVMRTKVNGEAIGPLRYTGKNLTSLGDAAKVAIQWHKNLDLIERAVGGGIDFTREWVAAGAKVAGDNSDNTKLQQALKVVKDAVDSIFESLKEVEAAMSRGDHGAAWDAWRQTDTPLNILDTNFIGEWPEKRKAELEAFRVYRLYKDVLGMSSRPRVAAWNNLPEGWTQESVQSFWDSLTGDVKHKVTKCMKQMEGKVDDTGAFCGSLSHKVDY